MFVNPIVALRKRRPFTFSVKTDNAGISSNNQFTVPTVSGGTYDCYIKRSDGVISNRITTWNDAAWTQTHAGGAGTYTYEIHGTFKGLYFFNGGDKLKLLNISQWGCFNTGNQDYVFYGCSNLTITATDNLDLTGTTRLVHTFRDCSSITTIPSLNSWNTSAITTFNSMFLNCSNFNQPITGISFAGITASTGIDQFLMSCTSFNSSVSALSTMSSAVTSLYRLFYACNAFNQDVSFINTSNITRFEVTLYQCSAFDQDLSSWDFSAATNMANFLLQTTLSDANYEALWVRIGSQSLQSSVTFHGGNSKWRVGKGARARYTVISTKSWTVTDGGQSNTALKAYYVANNLLKSTANPADGTDVATWSDLSSSGFNATEATNKPTFETNEINGYPIVRFNGTSDILDITGAIALTNQTDCTFFLVLKSTASGSAVRVLSFDNGAAGARGYLVKTSSNQYGFNIGTSAAGAAAVQAPSSISATNILRCYRNGNTLGISINNSAATQATNTNTPITDFGGIAIGAFSGGGGGFWAGDLAEFIVYNNLLSADEITRVQNDLATTYGVTLS